MAAVGGQVRQGVGSVVVRLEGFAPQGTLVGSVGPLAAAVQIVNGVVELAVVVGHGAEIGVYPVQLAVEGAPVGGLGSVEVTAITAGPEGGDVAGKGTTAQPFRSLSKAASLSDEGDRITLEEGSYGPEVSGEAFPLELPPGITVEGQGLVALTGVSTADLLRAKGSLTLRSLLVGGAKRGLLVTEGFTEVLLEDVEMDGFTEQGIDIQGKAAVTLRRSAPGSARGCEIRQSQEEALRVQDGGLVALQGCVLRGGDKNTILANKVDLLSLEDTALIGTGKNEITSVALNLDEVGLFEMKGGSVEKYWIGLLSSSTDASITGTRFAEQKILMNGGLSGYAIDPCGGTLTLEGITVEDNASGVAVFPMQKGLSCAGTKINLLDSKVTGTTFQAFLGVGNHLIRNSEFVGNAMIGSNAALGIEGVGSKLRLEDSRVISSPGYGVYAGDGASLEMIGTAPGKCLLQGNGFDGVLLYKNGYNASIEGCTVEDSGWSGVAVGYVSDQPATPFLGTLSISDSLLRNNNLQDLPERGGIVSNQVGSLTLKGLTLQDNRRHGLLLRAPASGAVTLQGGAITGTLGDGITARSAGSLTLQGTQVGQSGQGNLGNGLLLDGDTSLVVKIRGSSFAGNLQAALQISSGTTQVDLGTSSEPGDNELLGNVTANLGKTPDDSPLAEILDTRTSGPPMQVRGLKIDGVSFLTTPQLYPGPLALGAFGHRYGLRITAQGAVQSF
jgi:hypothetical protein